MSPEDEHMQKDVSIRLFMLSRSINYTPQNTLKLVENNVLRLLEYKNLKAGCRP